MKTLPGVLDDLIRFGLLHEINRRVLHPAGYALSLADGVLALSKGPDYFLPKGVFSPSKAAQVRQLTAEAEGGRLATFGWTVQPDPNDPGHPIKLATDDLTVEHIIHLTQALASRVAGGIDLVEGALLEYLPGLLRALRVLPDAGVAFIPEEAKVNRSGLSPLQMQRGLWLARELPRLCARHEIAGGLDEQGDAIRVFIDTQLFPEEIEKARAISARVLATWHPQDMPEDAPEDLRQMEELFGLGQPGMLFFRGGRPDIKLGTPTIKDALAKWRSSREEEVRFLAGEISAEELSQPEKVKQGLQERIEPLASRLADLENETRAINNALAPLKRALERLE